MQMSLISNPVALQTLTYHAILFFAFLGLLMPALFLLSPQEEKNELYESHNHPVQPTFYGCVSL